MLEIAIIVPRQIDDLPKEEKYNRLAPKFPKKPHNERTTMVAVVEVMVCLDNSTSQYWFAQDADCTFLLWRKKC